MQIKVWSSFSKRINSTKQPAGGSTVDVLLKAETDIKNPSFILTSTDFTINYVMAFGNYYFCTPVNLDGSRLELKCTMDYLATFKANVGAYSGLIEYTSSSSNLKITDPRNSPAYNLSSSSTSFVWTSGHSLDASAGTFILSYMSDSASSTGLCTYAAMDWGALGEFSYELFSQNILDEIKDQFTNMKDALISLMWLPLSYSDLPGNVVSSLTVGRETITLTNHQAKIITGRTMDLETGNLIWAPPSLYGVTPYVIDTYLAKPPYTTTELYLPYVGLVQVSTDLLAEYGGSTTINIKGAVDILTGDISYMLYMGGVRISTYSGNIATHLPISSASYNAFSAVGGAITTIGGLAASAVGFAAGSAAVGFGGIAAAAHSAMDTAKSLSIDTQISGTNSSAIGQKFGVIPAIIAHTYYPVEKNLLAFQGAHGMPYFQVATVSSLSGYVKCADASVNLPGDGSEQDVVNGYMNSGFYYE